MSGLSDSDNQFVEAEAPGQPEAVVTRRILLIDADTSFRKELRQSCEQYGYQVVEAETAADGLREFDEKQPSLVVLDVVLPDGSGFDLCRTIRRQDARVPVMIVSSRGEEIDVVVGLEIGADDYVIKPARTRELLARIAAHLRKARLDTQESSPGRLEFKDLAIDINERRVFKDGQEVDLTHTEFDLLAYLASHAGKVMSREKILNHVWGYEYPIETRLIDVHIRNLRRKIETNSSRPYYILAVPGIGYRFTSARA
ncbi:MAG: response regulator transcription factor [Chloroflexi bacterium]|nr:MAG: response regulator transcription factor [Chloroflexota bacterium]TME17152.1 MAG: response regulator transcription factor [Chloroflexota bacterium]TME17219.1 MAG: response regulator transcription factor [Chloroflexota bacterium]